MLGILGFTGATLSAAATGSAAMLFGLGVDGVVLLYVSHRLALARGLDPHEAVQSHRRAVEEHAARHVDDSGDVLRADVRRLSESAGAGAAGRAQHGGVRTGHAVARARDAAAQRSHGQRALVLPGLAAWILRHRTAILVGSLVATVLLGAAAARIRINPTLERLRSTTDAAALEARIASTFGLPGEVSVIVAQGRDLERLLTTNEALVARLAQSCRLFASKRRRGCCRQSSRNRNARGSVDASGITATRCGHPSPSAAQTAGFQPGAFDAFAERVPRLLDSGLRLTYDGYVAHGFRDLIGRFISHTRRRMDARHLCVSANARGVDGNSDRRRCRRLRRRR